MGLVNMPQEQMPERVIAYRSNVDGSIMVVPLMDGEEPNIDETLFIRATLLTEARELLSAANAELVSLTDGNDEIKGLRRDIKAFLERTK